MLASSLIVGGGLGMTSAMAADGPGTAGATAKLLPGLKFSGQIKIGDRPAIDGGLFKLLPAGEQDEKKALLAYCIDLMNPTQPDAEYNETDWKSSSLAGKPEAAAKIKWILLNSFPTKSVDDLKKASGIADLDENEAAAGTQAAIWSFSDGADAKPVKEDAAALTKYLKDKVADVKQGEEPKASLSLEPASVAGKSGEQLGPITVKSNSDSVNLALDEAGKKAGVVLTDKDGKPVTTAKNGDQFFAKTPAGAEAGSAKVTASTEAELSVGRAFVGEKNGKHSQTLILAGTKPVKTNAVGKVSWAPTGPIPAVTAKVDCVQNAVVVTATNKGDQEWKFELSGKTVTVKPGETQTIPVKVAEDAKYDFTITGPFKFSERFQGILNCKTDSSTASPTAPAPSASPTGPQLATTGGGAGTGLMAGIAGALVLAGGGAVFALRRRGRHSGA
ncbi:Cys-Gln thioester bond-forming surface protein [Kitasatospora camelliae]|uniref:Cys-Gln thioester bond-forming surface protein n=1 Tax=Kitasatospora camelliae TaxID=3156397 RepID=A0AAU8JZ88_9ACTN